MCKGWNFRLDCEENSGLLADSDILLSKFLLHFFYQIIEEKVWPSFFCKVCGDFAFLLLFFWQ